MQQLRIYLVTQTSTLYEMHNEPEVLSNENKTSAPLGDTRQFAWFLHGTSNNSEHSNVIESILAFLLSRLRR